MTDDTPIGYGPIIWPVGVPDYSEPYDPLLTLPVADDSVTRARLEGLSRVSRADIAVTHARAFGAIPPGQAMLADFSPGETADTGVRTVKVLGTGATAYVEVNKLRATPPEAPVPDEVASGLEQAISSIEVHVEGATLDSFEMELPLYELVGLGTPRVARLDPVSLTWVPVDTGVADLEDRVVLSVSAPGQSVYIIIAPHQVVQEAPPVEDRKEDFTEPAVQEEVLALEAEEQPGFPWGLAAAGVVGAGLVLWLARRR